MREQEQYTQNQYDIDLSINCPRRHSELLLDDVTSTEGVIEEISSLALNALFETVWIKDVSITVEPEHEESATIVLRAQGMNSLRKAQHLDMLIEDKLTSALTQLFSPLDAEHVIEQNGDVNEKNQVMQKNKEHKHKQREDLLERIKLQRKRMKQDAEDLISELHLLSERVYDFLVVTYNQDRPTAKETLQPAPSPYDALHQRVFSIMEKYGDKRAFQADVDSQMSLFSIKAAIHMCKSS